MSSALIIIDLINEIIGQTGRSNASYQQTLERQVVSKSNSAAAFARDRGIPVIWVRIGFADDYHDAPPHSPLFSKAKHFNALKLSESGCDWIEGLDVQPQDEIVVKKAVSAFVGNQLQLWLQSRGYTHLLIAGVSSAMAIESTARYAHDMGFSVTVLEDLCAAPTEDIHQQSMDALLPMAKITTSEQWMADFI